jgi:DmsE family decaheme c-type cytochrome
MLGRQILKSAIFAALAAVLSLFAVPASAQAPGPDACAGCHADAVASYQSSIHGKAGHAKTPAATTGCASCHANTAEHVKAGGGKGGGGIVNLSPSNKKLPAAAKDAVCMGCHGDNRHLTFWDSGRHRKNDVSCSNCHNPHGGDSALLRAENPPIRGYVNTSQVPQQEVCYQCHRDIRSLVMRPSHHPIPEGKVKCSSCHNPHGALSDKMVNNESVRDLCISCHADKRGPYLYDHPPVEENCLACHNPHGSRSAKLLNEKVPNLCQDCHDAAQHPGTLYDMSESFKGSGPSNRFFARSCLNCHNEIHGSNSPGARGRRFIR